MLVFRASAAAAVCKERAHPPLMIYVQHPRAPLTGLTGAPQMSHCHCRCHHCCRCRSSSTPATTTTQTDVHACGATMVCNYFSLSMQTIHACKLTSVASPPPPPEEEDPCAASTAPAAAMTTGNSRRNSVISEQAVRPKKPSPQTRHTPCGRTGWPVAVRQRAAVAPCCGGWSARQRVAPPLAVACGHAGQHERWQSRQPCPWKASGAAACTAGGMQRQHACCPLCCWTAVPGCR